MNFGRESYGRSKLAQPSSFPVELGQKSPAEGGQLGLTQIIPVEVGYTQLIPAKLGHTQLILAELGHTQLIPLELGQKRSAHPKRAWQEEVSSARRAQLSPKRSARPEELSSAQRGQLGQKSSATQLILLDPYE